jgi:hypothetical protein
MGNLEKSLERHWPPHRVIVTCQKCGDTILDTNEKKPAISAADYLANLIDILSRKHRESFGHSSIDVGITPEPSPVREIDCDITINRSEES